MRTNTLCSRAFDHPTASVTLGALSSCWNRNSETNFAFDSLTCSCLLPGPTSGEDSLPVRGPMEVYP